MLNWSNIENKLIEKSENKGYFQYLLKSIFLKNTSIDGDIIRLQFVVTNILIKDLCEKHIVPELVTEIAPKILQIEYIVESAQYSFATEADDLSNNTESTTLQTTANTPDTNFTFKYKYSLNRFMTFDNLVITAENDFVQKSLKAISDTENHHISCVSIFGPSGSGKTHLLNSVGWDFLSKSTNLKIKIVSGDEFVNDFQNSVYRRTMPVFRDKYRLKTDVLLIDDIHSMQKAKGTQAELFNLINDFASSNKKIIITSDQDITLNENFDERLKSRFLGGLFLSINSPSQKSKAIYLQSKLQNLQINLNENLFNAVLSNAGSCFRSIDGLLVRLQMLKKMNGHLTEELIF